MTTPHRYWPVLLFMTLPHYIPIVTRHLLKANRCDIVVGGWHRWYSSGVFFICCCDILRADRRSRVCSTFAAATALPRFCCTITFAVYTEQHLVTSHCRHSAHSYLWIIADSCIHRHSVLVGVKRLIHITLLYLVLRTVRFDHCDYFSVVTTGFDIYHNNDLLGVTHAARSLPLRWHNDVYSDVHTRPPTPPPFGLMPFRSEQRHVWTLYTDILGLTGAVVTGLPGWFDVVAVFPFILGHSSSAIRRYVYVTTPPRLHYPFQHCFVTPAVTRCWQHL